MQVGESIYELRLRIAEEKLDKQANDIAQMKLDAELRERSRLKAGIGALGSIVLVLGGVLWSYRSVIFR